MYVKKPNRLPGADYSRDKLYFVTSCVQDRVCCLGNVMDHKMVLNTYGEICERQWYWLAERYRYVILHAFVVMPNHIHGVIEIDSLRVDAGTKIKSLSELMGAFKTTTSKQIHLSGLRSFEWQKSFYDHIIRRGDSYDRICAYIRNNPAKWARDRFGKF